MYGYSVQFSGLLTLQRCTCTALPTGNSYSSPVSSVHTALPTGNSYSPPVSSFPRGKQPKFPKGEIPLGKYSCKKKKKKVKKSKSILIFHTLPFSGPRRLVYLWWESCGLCFYINQPSLPTSFYSVLLSISIFMALSTVFHSINAPDTSPLSHSVLLVLFLPLWSFQLYISLWKSLSALI